MGGLASFSVPMMRRLGSKRCCKTLAICHESYYLCKVVFMDFFSNFFSFDFFETHGELRVFLDEVAGHSSTLAVLILSQSHRPASATFQRIALLVANCHCNSHCRPHHATVSAQAWMRDNLVCCCAGGYGGEHAFASRRSGGASRRQGCHSATPPAPFRRCRNREGERESVSKITVPPTARRGVPP